MKSSVRYAAFFDSAGTADGAGFLVDKNMFLLDRLFSTILDWTMFGDNVVKGQRHV